MGAGLGALGVTADLDLGAAAGRFGPSVCIINGDWPSGDEVSDSRM